ncbi:hypothetical protein [Nocardioides donggukensis]|uniref:Uncharacterized protein n=1 Tax=Nocardioides donggukensis TaxID=2774019 RepID=A0A927K3T9_9ACTN|nr:hypothetical protein [Nocardioides donggukensis]MBD8869301.1 hypothetical protein [Nocardioides donggukensis]
MFAPVLVTLTLVGFLLEAAGLIVTATGLVQTWRNFTDQPLFPRVQRARLWLVAKLRGPRVHSASGTAVSTSRTTGWATGHTPMVRGTPDETTAERLDRLEGETAKLFDKAVEITTMIVESKLDAQRAVSDLRSDLDATEQTLTRLTRKTAVHGVQTAVTGLVLITFGVVFQGAAALMTALNGL